MPIRIDILETGCGGIVQIHLAEDTVQWQVLVKAVEYLRVQQMSVISWVAE
jgi:hypothetical protein